MSHRLAANQRVRNSQSFQQIYKKGRYARSKHLGVWLWKAEDRVGAPPCLGVVVSKKVHLRATKRNLWKRRIKEAFRLMQEKIEKDTAVVAHARKSETIPSYQEIAAELEEKLIKLNGLNEHVK